MQTYLINPFLYVRCYFTTRPYNVYNLSCQWVWFSAFTSCDSHFVYTGIKSRKKSI